MGVAAYQRGNKAIREAIERGSRDGIFQFMDHLNALPKYEDAGRPFGAVRLTLDEPRGIWWMEPADVPVGTSYGYCYRTLREAVRRWQIMVVGYEQPDTWFAQPII